MMNFHIGWSWTVMVLSDLLSYDGTYTVSLDDSVKV
jgi:hypothetical protein